MSLDEGLKRRKGETREACIERLLNMLGKNSETYNRLAQKNRDLEYKVKQLKEQLCTTESS